MYSSSSAVEVSQPRLRMYRAEVRFISSTPAQPFAASDAGAVDVAATTLPPKSPPGTGAVTIAEAKLASLMSAVTVTILDDDAPWPAATPAPPYTMPQPTTSPAPVAGAATRTAAAGAAGQCSFDASEVFSREREVEDAYKGGGGVKRTTFRCAIPCSLRGMAARP